MRKLAILLFISTFLASCQDDTGTLQLKFLATYDEAPLVLGENVAYDDYQLNFLESDFFISELALTNEGEVTQIKDIDFVDFTNTNFTLENAENGFILTYNDVPTGSFDGLRFGIGVPPSLNATRPSDYSSDEVLAQGGYYWEPWSSFIFAKLAGKYQDEQGSFDNGFFFHTGTDDLFRTSETALNISISEDNTTVIEITMDHKKLLEMQSGEFYDIQNNSANHDPTDPIPLLLLVNNYSDAINYNQ